MTDEYFEELSKSTEKNKLAVFQESILHFIRNHKAEVYREILADLLHSYSAIAHSIS